MISSATLALSLGLLAPLVKAHGQIKGVMANGVYNTGPNIYYDGDSVNDATVTRKMFQASSPSYLTYSDFSDNEKMACESAGPAPSSLTINAGSDLTIYWEGATSELLNQPGTGDTDGTNPWVHAMGPVTDYIASCNGDCSSFSAADAGNAGWTKLATWGLDTSQSISDDLRSTMAAKPEEYYPRASDGPGLWGMAKLVEDSSSWTVTIPSSLKTGQYIVRHELAAVHSPKSSGGSPQLYVTCIQLDVVDGGDDELPSGTQAGSLYETDGYLANYDVYDTPTEFEDIGPAVWNVVSGGSSSSDSSSDSTSSSAEAEATTSTEAAETSTSEAAAKPTTSATEAAVVETTSTEAAEPTTTSTEAATTTTSSSSSSSSGQCKSRNGRRTTLDNYRRSLDGHKRSVEKKRRLDGNH